MFAFLPPPVLGSISLAVLTLNTIFWCSLLLVVALLRLVIPMQGWRDGCSKILHAIGQSWIACNSLGLAWTKKIHWDVEGTEGLQRNAWYLVVANHQTWVDIVVLQKIFSGKIPMLKFFLKQELIWVPFLGIAWWALDFPFMKRSSSVRKDFDTTRKACERFKAVPVSVMNFVEGTRFTKAKQEQQESPYKHLLRPKAAGIALVLESMGEQIHSVLDVTIIYPKGPQDIWTFLCSKSLEVKVLVKQIPVSKEIIGDYLEDRSFRKIFNNWLDTLWKEKDQLIDSSIYTANT
jgi:1-acyl-sn-glycerol-3-phosphate acyltransferase